MAEETTGYKPPLSKFEVDGVVEMDTPILIPPSKDRMNWFILTEGSQGRVVSKYYVNPDEADFVNEVYGWHYAVLSTEVDIIFKVFEGALRTSMYADDFELGSIVVLREDLHYVPLFNNNDNETIPASTQAIVTEEADPDGFIRIAPIGLHSRRQYLVKPRQIYLDDED